jgi:hypothetical protein
MQQRPDGELKHAAAVDSSKRQRLIKANNNN